MGALIGRQVWSAKGVESDQRLGGSFLQQALSNAYLYYSTNLGAWNSLKVMLQKISIHCTSPTEGHWKSQGGGVWQKQKFFYWYFRRGRGRSKSRLWGRYGYFMEPIQCKRI